MNRCGKSNKGCEKKTWADCYAPPKSGNCKKILEAIHSNFFFTYDILYSSCVIIFINFVLITANKSHAMKIHGDGAHKSKTKHKRPASGHKKKKKKINGKTPISSEKEISCYNYDTDSTESEAKQILVRNKFKRKFEIL